MLYEVITEWSPENTPGLYLLRNPSFPDKPLCIEIPFYDEQDKTVMAYAQVWMKLDVITSYSIHYTKLYDTFRKIKLYPDNIAAE